MADGVRVADVAGMHTPIHGNGTQHPETDTVPMNQSVPETPHQSFG